MDRSESGPYLAEMIRNSLLTLSLATFAVASVGSLVHGQPSRARGPASPALVAFTDVTTRAGVTFRHTSGAFGKKYLPETMGAGVVVLDFDNDGHQDLFFANGKAWPGRPPLRSLPALYRSTGAGTFTDVTRAAGLAFEAYGMGAAAADYDNDGFVDLFVTALGGNRLFRNTGKGTFEDVTQRASVGRVGFSTSAAWFDYDKDGRLDLIVANYVQWQLEKDIHCTLDGKTKSYCTPESYKGETPFLFHNLGNGTFEDATTKAGLNDPASKGLGVGLLDYNADGYLDVFVANDTQPNRLYRNTGKGTFVDEAVTAGVAFNEAGVARAGMGVDAADFDGSGRPGLLIGNFSNEMLSLYRNEGNGLFIDDAPTSSLGRESLLSLTFACFFFDADNDGLLDIFTANGHVADDINRVQPKVTYAQASHLYRNGGKARFSNVAAGIPALMTPTVARGAAHLDMDNDGDQDLIVTVNNGPARVLRNDSAGGRALRLSLVGVKSNRSAIGAEVRVTTGGATRIGMVKTGSSYLSQSELPLTFGLGTATRVEQVEIRWPSGQVDRLGPQDAGQTLVVTEAKGVTRRVAFGR
ncbi:ASPIC and UnbV [Luteitalea pratensis]|uniref:ASPIC and UnbV n=1 Tax=Luteitalea pratensis TaxID=1855912 RepID=A0A143PW29_LUTPR|nr:ASPIC and UnbV [Luteitalea pratensis]